MNICRVEILTYMRKFILFFSVMFYHEHIASRFITNCFINKHYCHKLCIWINYILLFMVSCFTVVFLHLMHSKSIYLGAIKSYNIVCDNNNFS